MGELNPTFKPAFKTIWFDLVSPVSIRGSDMVWRTAAAKLMLPPHRCPQNGPDR